MIALIFLASYLMARDIYLTALFMGLNALEWSTGAEWCNEFLDVLLSRQEMSDSVFNILFTTCGQSKVLYRRIDIQDQIYATKSLKEVERRGRHMLLEALNDLI